MSSMASSPISGGRGSGILPAAQGMCPVQLFVTPYSCLISVADLAANKAGTYLWYDTGQVPGTP